jgi:hypothetical protein
MSTQYTTFEEYKTARVEEVLKDAEGQWKQIEQQQRLSGLFREFGFRSTADLISALQKVAEVKKAKAGKPGKPGKAKAPKAKGKRVKITPEIVVKVKELKAQGLSAGKISATLGISAASVYKLTK